MLSLLDTIKLGGAAFGGFAFGSLLFYQIGHWNSEDFGREAERSAARERAMDLIKQRSEDNEAISRLDMAGLCVELGGVWVPERSECR